MLFFQLGNSHADQNVELRPKKEGVKSHVSVFLDGKTVESAAGSDLRNGSVTVDRDWTYNLIKLSQSGDHVLRLEFQDDFVELFAFTFG